jgi:hypothetical protein
MSDDKKIWTMGQMNDKVREDTDLSEEDPDEQFVTLSMMIGFINEAIDEAEAEIMTIREDYFRTFDYLPLVEGVSEYDMPSNIYLQKLRGLVYANGTTIYPIKRFTNSQKFISMAFAEQYGTGDDYRYDIYNPSPTEGEKMVIFPPARETAILPPLDNQFVPVKRWYIRNANRVPLVGDYTNTENIRSDAVNAVTNVITVDPVFPYVTGDVVQVFLNHWAYLGGAILPTGLSADTDYYVIRVSDTAIKLATSSANATAGTPIDLTDGGTNSFSLKVKATEDIIRATIVDIPQFSTFIMEWVKANCLFKDGDPRLVGCVAKIEQQRKMMQDVLPQAQEDEDQGLIEADFSYYTEMN